MTETTDDAIARVLRSPVPRAAFAAALLHELTQRSRLPMIAVTFEDAASRGPWLVAGTVAGAVGAGIALLGLRRHRRRAA